MVNSSMKQPSTRTASRQKGPRTPAADLGDLKRLIRTVEKKLHAEISELRNELRASETALAAARLRTLNERQAHAGVARLQADLEALRGLGIIDEQGHRLRADLPAEMFESTPDVV